MSKLTFDITMSLDGFIAGRNPGPELPLGEGGEQLHEWVFGLRSWRELAGLEGGETNRDDEIVRESTANVGAVIMGRGMFGRGDEGPWDESWEGWWGDDPPYKAPVFVLSHHPREPVRKLGGTTFEFVTDGIEAALQRARAAAGDKNIAIAGGASVAQQYLRAGLLDDFQVHVAPIMLGGGTRLFGDAEGEALALEIVRVVESPNVTHVRYRVAR
jgi:dihydrofolate reductase